MVASPKLYRQFIKDREIYKEHQNEKSEFHKRIFPRWHILLFS